MIQVADNFNYRGKKPNFDRDSFDTLQDMKNYSENSLDDGHISYCKETDKHYKFNSNNQSDPTTGKWVEQHEAVPADEEDITEQNGTLQLANKTYDKQSFSGLGRVYLRKNIVGNKNVLTQAMINKAASDSSESYEYIKITKIPTSGFTFLYSTYNVLSKYSLLYLDNKLYILSDVYDTGNDSFLNIKYLFDSISYTLDIYIKVPTKYGKLIVRDTKWANLNTYQWYSKNTDPYPSEAVDAEFISSNVLTLPNTLIGTKTYDKFGNELTWSKSDWLNPDGSLVTKVIFASKLNDFTKNNTIYNIVRYIDLKGETLTIPENSVLNFIGGAIGNGTIIGNKTKVINLNVDRIILSGTWFDSGITSNRPTNVLVGFQYFDTTVNKPIFWDGSKWIDATGATV